MLLATVLFLIGLPLRTPAAVGGIVDFELAGTEDRARAILQSWQDRMGAVRWQLWLDFPFIFSYGGLLLLTARSAARALRDAQRALVRMAAWMAGALGIVAALLDMVENGFLLAMLPDRPSQTLVEWATTAARTKFKLLLATAALLALCWGQVIIGRARVGGARKRSGQ